MKRGGKELQRVEMSKRDIKNIPELWQIVKGQETMLGIQFADDAKVIVNI